MILRDLIISIFVNLLHDFTQEAVYAYPLLLCSLLNYRIVQMPFVVALVLLFASKVFLLLSPMKYHAANHTFISVLTIGSMVVFSLLDPILSSIFLKHGYCYAWNFKRLMLQNNLKTDIEIEFTFFAGYLFIFIILFILFVEMPIIAFFSKRYSVATAPIITLQRPSTQSLKIDQEVRTFPPIPEGKVVGEDIDRQHQAKPLEFPTADCHSDEEFNRLLQRIGSRRKAINSDKTLLTLDEHIPLPSLAWPDSQEIVLRPTDLRSSTAFPIVSGVKQIPLPSLKTKRILPTPHPSFSVPTRSSRVYPIFSDRKQIPPSSKTFLRIPPTKRSSSTGSIAGIMYRIIL